MGQYVKKHNHKSLIIGWFIAMVLFPLASFANVPVGGEVSQSAIASPYTTDCTSNYNYAIYEWQSFRSYYKHTPESLSSSREYFPNTNIKVYNPAWILWNLSWQNTLWGLLPAFIYKSNGRPGTQHFNFPGVESVYAYRQNDDTFAINPSANTSRTTIAAQIVHDFFRKQIQSRFGNPYTMTFVPFGSSTSQSFTATPSAWFSMWEIVKCQNFYIAKCGDSVVDNANKAGDNMTDGLSGILVNNTMVNRRNSGFTWETCDDGPLNGTADHCDINCGRGWGVGYCGDNIINDGWTDVWHWPTYFSGGIEMIEQCDDGPRDENTSSGNHDGYQFTTCGSSYCELNTEPETLPEELGQ